jgi:hypothetical protein
MKFRPALSVWPPEEVRATDRLRPALVHECSRGGQRRYSDTVIQSAFTLRLLFSLPLRQTEGFLRSLLELSDLSIVGDGEWPCGPTRDATVRRGGAVGRREWKRESGYHRHGTVGNAFSRCKTMIGPALRARDEQGRRTQARLGCLLLNRMRELAWPDSAAIHAYARRRSTWRACVSLRDPDA